MPLPYVSFLVLLPVAVVLMWPLRSVLDRYDGALAGAAAALGGLGLLLWPLDRYRLEDPAGTMLPLFQGERALDAATSRFISPPAMEVLAAGLGRLGVEDPTVLIAPSVIAGVVWMWAMAVLVRLLTGRRSLAWVSLALFALDPERLSWSHAAYHVMVPTAFLGIGMLASAASSRIERGRVVLLVAAGLWAALAVSVRLDFLAYLPLVVALSGTGDRRSLVVVPGAALLGLGVLFVGSQLGSDLDAAGWSVGSAARASASASAGGELLAPWFPAVVFGVLVPLRLIRLGWEEPRSVDVAASLPRTRWIVLPLLLAALGESTFFDFGARHLLPARGVLGVILARELLPYRVHTALAACALPLFLFAAYERHGTWYADPPRGETPPASLAGGIYYDEGDMASLTAGCVVVAYNDDYFPAFDRVRRVDHLTMLDPAVVAELWVESGGCLLWIRDMDDLRWLENVRLSRARRLDALWEWRHLGNGRRDRDQSWFGVLRLEGHEQPITRSPVVASLRSVAPGAFGGVPADGGR